MADVPDIDVLAADDDLPILEPDEEAPTTAHVDVSGTGSDDSGGDAGGSDAGGKGEDTWTSVFNTGIKTAGDIAKTAIDQKEKNGQSQDPTTKPPNAGSTTGPTPPMVPAVQPVPAAAPAAPSNTGLYVGFGVGGALILAGLIAAAASRSQRKIRV